MDLLARIRRFVREHDLMRSDTRVVVALSGGADSVALAHLVRELDAAGEVRAAGAAHFNHQLRATAERDERFSVGLAESFGWPIMTDREDVAAKARRERRSLEDAARTARHEFLERARTHLGADVVAVGHTRDDQAETFLLRLVRGAGARGLAAMHPRNGPIVRPLLDCRRSAVRAYLDERHIAYVEDESNQDVAIPRNRVRAELMPLLEVRFNPAIIDVLAGEAEIARDEWRWMQASADDLVRAAVLRSDAVRCHAEFDVAMLMAAPVALRRLVLWRAMTDASGGRPVAFDHVQAVLRLLEPDAHASGIDAPGHRAERIGSRLVLTSKPPGAVGRWSPNRENPANLANLFWYPLSIPGEVRLLESGWVVSANLANSANPANPENPENLANLANPRIAIVRSDVCRGPLAVRNRRPGDRFHPVGVGGQKKLQDFFVDRKVARQQRDLVPLVVDHHDRIVWVAGYGIDAEFRVTDPTQTVLILRLRQV
ncbi:MAG: tRNA lysidine(34) synthetase TilS [Acidobacteria bacterium]|nr:MAG: tRNA lysidine(34) synthetase TilS [Acidobacteriota bacterium]